MKTLLPLFILIFAFVANGQTVQEKINAFEDKKQYSYEYDKFKDTSRVRAANISVKSSNKHRASIYFGSVFLFTGEKISDNADKFYLIFHDSCPSWCFLNNHNLTFLADGEKVDLGQGDHDGKVNTGYGRSLSVSVSEFMAYPILRDDLIKIINAKTSEFQLGNYEAVLTDKHKQMLKNMLTLGSVK